MKVENDKCSLNLLYSRHHLQEHVITIAIPALSLSIKSKLDIVLTSRKRAVMKLIYWTIIRFQKSEMCFTT